MTTWATESDQSSTWETQARFNENLIPYSSDFTQWFGTTTDTINTIADTSTTVTQQAYLEATAIVSDYATQKPRCFSLRILKDDVPASTRFMVMRMGYNIAANVANLRIDTKTGEFLLVNIGNTTVYGYGVEDEDDYWRAWISSDAPGDFYRINIFPAFGNVALSNSIESFIVTVTGTITVKDAQLEDGESPSGYMPTSGSAITWEIA